MNLLETVPPQSRGVLEGAPNGVLPPALDLLDAAFSAAVPAPLAGYESVLSQSAARVDGVRDNLLPAAKPGVESRPAASAVRAPFAARRNWNRELIVKIVALVVALIVLIFIYKIVHTSTTVLTGSPLPTTPTPAPTPPTVPSGIVPTPIAPPPTGGVPPIVVTLPPVVVTVPSPPPVGNSPSVVPTGNYAFRVNFIRR